jgi:putative restriction endonuclease
VGNTRIRRNTGHDPQRSHCGVNAIRVWTNGDRRAVHKPLLVLLALSRVNDVTAQTMDWNDAEPLLKILLEEFGPDGSSNTRHYPFWHLQTDGLWQLDGPPEILNRPAGATPTLTELRQNHVRGGFTIAHLHRAEGGA